VTAPTVVPVLPANKEADRPAGGSRRPSAAASATAGASASAAPPAPAASPPAASRILPLAELPEAVRRQLPPLTLGGSVYSEQPAQRLVIVNGQVTHEGDQPASQLQVVQIRPRSVVFSFHGQLFELPL